MSLNEFPAQQTTTTGASVRDNDQEQWRRCAGSVDNRRWQTKRPVEARRADEQAEQREQRERVDPTTTRRLEHGLLFLERHNLLLDDIELLLQRRTRLSSTENRENCAHSFAKKEIRQSMQELDLIRDLTQTLRASNNNNASAFAGSDIVTALMARHRWKVRARAVAVLSELNRRRLLVRVGGVGEGSFRCADAVSFSSKQT